MEGYFNILIQTASRSIYIVGARYLVRSTWRKPSSNPSADSVTDEYAVTCR